MWDGVQRRQTGPVVGDGAAGALRGREGQGVDLTSGQVTRLRSGHTQDQ